VDYPRASFSHLSKPALHRRLLIDTAARRIGGTEAYRTMKCIAIDWAERCMLSVDTRSVRDPIAGAGYMRH